MNKDSDSRFTVDGYLTRQQAIAQNIILKDRFKAISLIGGVDVAFDKSYAYGGFVVLSFPELKLIEQVTSKVKITYPTSLVFCF